ncbi:MAG: EF-P beta-lysylation protein EpmB [Wenzhouxiangellaceae bacterium]|nr:EF-P beta-lysylation protein EpmB [Wenzhouxiangellaceae bacterium]
MIPVRKPLNDPSDWRDQLREGWRDARDLLAHLGLADHRFDLARDTAFPVRVPRAFSDRMRRGDPTDPLLRQVLPLAVEDDEVPGFVDDPVGDDAASRGNGLLRKYGGRALLVTTGACAVHCRYCFRREFPYSSDQATPSSWDAIAAELAADDSVEEVILSGGDPWMLDDDRLGRLTRALARVPHLRRLRIHTRMPIVLPDRVDAGLASWLSSLPWQPVVVVHANHPAELAEDVAAAVARLREAGATIFNQAVLLAGVNDSVESLEGLMQRGFEIGIVPYYLHLLDRVRGSAHFEVPEARALELHEALRRRLPGYLVPRLVREQAGAPYKVPLQGAVRAASCT